MNAQQENRLPGEALGAWDDLPGVGGILITAVIAGGMLVALLFMG